MIIEHCKKITVADVQSLGVRNKTLVPNPFKPVGSNSSNGVSVFSAVTTNESKVNLSSEVDSSARLSKLIEGPDTGCFDL
jgi:hypothetical protein